MIKKALIVTLSNDRSIPLLLDAAKKQGIALDVLYIEDIAKNERILPTTPVDVLYIRGAFLQNILSLPETVELVNYITSTVPHVYSVDGIESGSDGLIADKWVQYSLYGNFMPETFLLSDMHEKMSDEYIIKKRFSSRSKDIYFSLPDHITEYSDYVVQKKLDIVNEYRIYAFGSHIYTLGTGKSSRTPDKKTFILEGVHIDTELRVFAEEIASVREFDLAGYDIAKTPDGYKLIEVNRSPQFNVYHKRTDINLAEELFARLSIKFDKLPG